MTEWLFVIVPLLLAPMVLLVAFSGCSTVLQIQPPRWSLIPIGTL